jgi:peptide/nickel transport system substrate-binding protein
MTRKGTIGFLSQAVGILVALAILASPAVAGKKDDTLNIAWEKELESLDLYYNSAREGIIVSRLIYDNLLYRDPDTFDYKPLLATAYKWVDNVTMDVDLRQGVTFHNGEPFGADDVVFTVNYVVDPESKVLVKQNVDWLKSAEKLGPHKVRLHLKQPFPAALEYLAGYLPIYPHKYYAKVGTKGFSVKPVGTGPYMLTELDPGKRTVYVRNEKYFKDSPKGRPAIKTIVQRTIPEVNTKIAELMTGGLDWAWLIPKDQAEKLAKMPNLTVIPAETMRVGFLYLDAAGRTGEDSPFKKLAVRQAINYAVDRQAMVTNLVGGESRVIHSACFPTQFGCTDEGVTKYEYNPEKAKKLLAEAGYANGFETELWAYRERPYAEAVVGYLHAVGIKAKLVYGQYSAMREKAQADKVPVAFWTWGSYSINDCSAITGYWFKFTSDDYARDEKVRDWLQEGDNNIDPAVRKENYKKALQRIAEQAYWLPMFTWVSNYAFSKELDFKPYPDEVPRFFLAKWK